MPCSPWPHASAVTAVLPGDDCLVASVSGRFLDIPFDPARGEHRDAPEIEQHAVCNESAHKRPRRIYTNHV